LPTRTPIASGSLVVTSALVSAIEDPSAVAPTPPESIRTRLAVSVASGLLLSPTGAETTESFTLILTPPSATTPVPADTWTMESEMTDTL
jgi:hypothetical protein